MSVLDLVESNPHNVLQVKDLEEIYGFHSLVLLVCHRPEDNVVSLGLSRLITSGPSVDAWIAAHKGLDAATLLSELHAFIV